MLSWANLNLKSVKFIFLLNILMKDPQLKRFSAEIAHHKVKCMCNVDPPTPHFHIFHILQLVFTVIRNISLFCSKHRLWILVRIASILQNIICGYPLKPLNEVKISP